MVEKFINAHGVKVGTSIMINENPCIVKSIDISKTGKHGASKCRIEGVGIVDGKKRVIVVPGSTKIDIPRIEKRKAQILSISGDKASVMDLETFETMDLSISEEVKNEISEGKNVEYWDIEGTKIIKRVMG